MLKSTKKDRGHLFFFSRSFSFNIIDCVVHYLGLEALIELFVFIFVPSPQE